MESATDIDMRDIDILTFWGKAQPQDADTPSWHPLVLHCLDVAAVGHVLMTHSGGFGDRIGSLLGLSGNDAAQVVRFLLSLHDVGKFARKFQAKAPEHYPDCFPDDPARFATAYDHASGGFRLFREQRAIFKFPAATHRLVWQSLMSAVTGHHGEPPVSVSNSELKQDFGEAGIQAAVAFIERMHELLAIPDDVFLDYAAAKRASFAVAGLAVLADWIGSNQRWFCYREPTEDLESYWQDTLERAGRAVRRAGVLPATAHRHVGYPGLIGPKAVPSPMQIWARDVNLPPGPALFVIEDETGSGKTEAGLMLAHRLMAAGRAKGLYFALPTMATANAMFDRLDKSVRHLFATGSDPSVALAHGARQMHDGFRAAVLRGGRAEVSYSGDRHADADDTTASAACAAWIADDRRRTFLADVGAGTIDQALLAILPSRHQSIRLLGLSRGVLILDEVHAYDAYMRREMEALLEFQAALGGSAILLSATLPIATRRQLTDAFAKGLGGQASCANRSAAYPLATICAEDVLSTATPPGETRRARSLPVRFLDTADDAYDELQNAVGAGKAALYIRNTVDDALDAHDALASRGIDAHLFHARFALADRLAVEQRVVRLFGKHSETPERRGQVLIGTQVVEQSLDLDFDVLITDLAPIDLVIQRAGRLWRHERSDREGQPELLVVGPSPAEDADEEWYKRAFPRAAMVYPDHARLWLTAQVLHGEGRIRSPHGLRKLIEAVYGEGVDERVPDSLVPELWDAEGRTGADRAVATTNVLECSGGYERDGGAWDRDYRTPTRLDDDPQVTLRLARFVDGRVIPYAVDTASDEPWRAWRLSEVNVSARRVGGEALRDLRAASEVAKADWTHFDSEKILVVLEGSADGAELAGVAAKPQDQSEVQLHYGASKGLTVRSTV